MTYSKSYKPKRPRTALRAVSAALILAFAAQDFASAAGTAPLWPTPRTASKTARGEKLSETFRLPSALGLRRGASAGSSETVVQIEDAHDSLEAQKKITGILDVLSREYDVRSVALEGSSGSVDPSLFRTFPDAAWARRSAEKLMGEGRLSAGEFFAITSDAPVAVYGVEENRLYRENLKAFRDLLERRQALRGDLDGLARTVDVLASRVYGPKVLALRDNAASVSSGDASFTRRWETLRSLAAERGLEPDSPALAALSRLTALEKEIDFEKANAEREALLTSLRASLRPEALDALVLRSIAYKEGRVSEGEYHLFLAALARRQGEDAARHPNLARYMNYVLLFESIDLASIFTEVAAFEERARELCFASEDERSLDRLEKRARILSALVSGTASAEDYAAYRRDPSRFSPEAFEAPLRELAERHHVPLYGGLRPSRLAAALPLASRFYALASRRDAVLVANTLRRMRAENRRVAALVTGGFHTRGVSELLKSENLSYLIVTPRITDPGAKRPYITILTRHPEEREKAFASETGRYRLALSNRILDLGRAMPGSGREELRRLVGELAAGLKNAEEARAWMRNYAKAYAARGGADADVSPETVAALLSEMAPRLGAGDLVGTARVGARLPLEGNLLGTARVGARLPLEGNLLGTARVGARLASAADFRLAIRAAESTLRELAAHDAAYRPAHESLQKIRNENDLSLVFLGAAGAWRRYVEVEGSVASIDTRVDLEHLVTTIGEALDGALPENLSPENANQRVAAIVTRRFAASLTDEYARLRSRVGHLHRRLLMASPFFDADHLYTKPAYTRQTDLLELFVNRAFKRHFTALRKVIMETHEKDAVLRTGLHADEYMLAIQAATERLETDFEFDPRNAALYLDFARAKALAAQKTLIEISDANGVPDWMPRAIQRLGLAADALEEADLRRDPTRILSVGEPELLSISRAEKRIRSVSAEIRTNRLLFDNDVQDKFEFLTGTSGLLTASLDFLSRAKNLQGARLSEGNPLGTARLGARLPSKKMSWFKRVVVYSPLVAIILVAAVWVRTFFPPEKKPQEEPAAILAARPDLPRIAADPQWRFARNIRTEAIVKDPDLREAYIREFIRWEGRFHRPYVAYNPVSGLAYDGHWIDVETGELLKDGLRRHSAASKEAIHIAILSLAVLGRDENARLFVSPDDPSKAEALALDLLERKMKSFLKFAEDPANRGFGYFLPWYMVSDEGLTPMEGWTDRVPSLDNGELMLAMYETSIALKWRFAQTRDERVRRLAEAYDAYFRRMAENAPVLFYAGEGRVRTEAKIADVTAAPAPDNYRAPAEPFYLDDPYDGQTTVFAMSFFGGMPAEEVRKIWEAKRAKLEPVAYPGHAVTVARGNWYSAHEQRGFLFVPYLEVPIMKRLFRAGEVARTLYSAENGKPGLYGSSHDAAKVNAGSAYLSSLGVPPLARQATVDTVVAPYAAFPVILADRTAGTAWLHTMLKGRRMQGPNGASEASSVTGEAIAPILTWDGKGPTVLAYLGGVAWIVDEGLREEGRQADFRGLVERHYGERFPTELGEDRPLALPTAELPAVIPDFKGADPRNPGARLSLKARLLVWAMRAAYTLPVAGYLAFIRFTGGGLTAGLAGLAAGTALFAAAQLVRGGFRRPHLHEVRAPFILTVSVLSFDLYLLLLGQVFHNAQLETVFLNVTAFGLWAFFGLGVLNGKISGKARWAGDFFGAHRTRLLLLAAPAAAWTSNWVVTEFFPAYNAFHDVSFIPAATRALVAGGFALIWSFLFVVAGHPSFRVSVGLVLYLAGGLANAVECFLFGGAANPFTFVSGHPNVADLFMATGLGFMLFDYWGFWQKQPEWAEVARRAFFERNEEKLRELLKTQSPENLVKLHEFLALLMNYEAYDVLLRAVRHEMDRRDVTGGAPDDGPQRPAVGARLADRRDPLARYFSWPYRRLEHTKGNKVQHVVKRLWGTEELGALKRLVIANQDVPGLGQLLSRMTLFETDGQFREVAGELFAAQEILARIPGAELLALNLFLGHNEIDAVFRLSGHPTLPDGFYMIEAKESLQTDPEKVFSGTMGQVKSQIDGAKRLRRLGVPLRHLIVALGPHLDTSEWEAPRMYKDTEDAVVYAMAVRRDVLEGPPAAEPVPAYERVRKWIEEETSLVTVLRPLVPALRDDGVFETERRLEGNGIPQTARDRVLPAPVDSGTASSGDRKPVDGTGRLIAKEAAAWLIPLRRAKLVRNNYRASQEALDVLVDHFAGEVSKGKTIPAASEELRLRFAASPEKTWRELVEAHAGQGARLSLEGNLLGTARLGARLSLEGEEKGPFEPVLLGLQYFSGEMRGALDAQKGMALFDKPAAALRGLINHVLLAQEAIGRGDADAALQHLLATWAALFNWAWPRVWDAEPLVRPFEELVVSWAALVRRESPSAAFRFNLRAAALWIERADEEITGERKSAVWGKDITGRLRKLAAEISQAQGSFLEKMPEPFDRSMQIFAWTGELDEILRLIGPRTAMPKKIHDRLVGDDSPLYQARERLVFLDRLIDEERGLAGARLSLEGNLLGTARLGARLSEHRRARFREALEAVDAMAGYLQSRVMEMVLRNNLGGRPDVTSWVVYQYLLARNWLERGNPPDLSVHAARFPTLSFGMALVDVDNAERWARTQGALLYRVAEEYSKAHHSLMEAKNDLLRAYGPELGISPSEGAGARLSVETALLLAVGTGAAVYLTSLILRRVAAYFRPKHPAGNRFETLLREARTLSADLELAAGDWARLNGRGTADEALFGRDLGSLRTILSSRVLPYLNENDQGLAAEGLARLWETKLKLDEHSQSIRRAFPASAVRRFLADFESMQQVWIERLLADWAAK
ncbi:MAG TPA: hypothetical protein VL404_02875, partial [Candidatus Eisenbacteria bacterium]|nr:hypothetical protein [Candidatus Eisenbacteria bacterium]